jgi:hypothetical protein
VQRPQGAGRGPAPTRDEFRERLPAPSAEAAGPVSANYRAGATGRELPPASYRVRATGRWGGESSHTRCGSRHPTTRAEAHRRGRRCRSPWRPRCRAALWPFAHARLAPTSRPGPMSWASARRSWLSSARFLTGFVSARCFGRARDAACRNRMRGAPNSLLAPSNLPGCAGFLGRQVGRGYQIAPIRSRLPECELPGAPTEVRTTRCAYGGANYQAAAIPLQCAGRRRCQGGPARPRRPRRARRTPHSGAP